MKVGSLTYIVLFFCGTTVFAQKTVSDFDTVKAERKYPFEFFAGYNIPRQAFDLSLKFHIINEKPAKYGMRFGRMRGAPKKMCFLIGNEFYTDRSLNGLKAGLDFTPFYRLRFSTIQSHEVYTFSDFMFQTVGHLFLRANYVHYIDNAGSYSQNFRPEIGISSAFKLGDKHRKILKEKGIYRFHYLYVHPSISYGYDFPLNSSSSFFTNPRHFTIGISISYQTFFPINYVNNQH